MVNPNLERARQEVTQARNNFESNRTQSLNATNKYNSLVSQLQDRRRRDPTFFGKRFSQSNLRVELDQARREKNNAREKVKRSKRAFESARNREDVIRGKPTRSQTLTLAKQKKKQTKLKSSLNKLQVKQTKLKSQTRAQKQVALVTAKVLKINNDILIKNINKKNTNKKKLLRFTNGDLSATELLDVSSNKAQEIENKLTKPKIVKTLQNKTVKPIITVQDFLIANSKNLDPKNKTTRAKLLKNLENSSKSVKGDKILKGLGIGTAQILSNPVKYYANEELQDLVDLTTKPVETVKVTAQQVIANPKTYAGEIGAEILFFGSTETIAKKGSKKLDNVGKYIKKSSKKFLTEVAKKSPIGKILNIADKGSKAKKLYTALKVGVIATSTKTVKASEVRINNKINAEVKKLQDTNVITKDTATRLKKLIEDAKKIEANKKSPKLSKLEKSKLKTDLALSKTKTELKSLKSLLSKTKSSKTKKKIETQIKQKQKQKVKLETKTKKKTKLKTKKKTKLKTKQKLKLKTKLKQKTKKKEKQKTKLKQKTKKKEKQKPKLKLKTPSTKKRTKKARVTLKLDKKKPVKAKTFKQAKTKAEKHLLKTKGRQTAKITSSKKIKKVTKKKKGINYKVGPKKKTLKLSEPKKKKKVTIKRRVKKKVVPKKKRRVKKKVIRRVTKKRSKKK